MITVRQGNPILSQLAFVEGEEKGGGGISKLLNQNKTVLYEYQILKIHKYRNGRPRTDK